MSDYSDATTLKAWLQITDSSDDTLLGTIITTVSRWIDGYCGRRFYLDNSATARVFAPTDSWWLCVDDIGSTSGLQIATGQGDGTFPTTLTSSQYELRPANAAVASPEAKPYTEILAVGTWWPPKIWTGRPETVQVTAKWGWPAVPAAVAEACVIQSARVFKRRYSPEGVAGFGDFGVVRVSTRLDIDVQQLLAPYRALTLVG